MPRARAVGRGQRRRRVHDERRGAGRQRQFEPADVVGAAPAVGAEHVDERVLQRFAVRADDLSFAPQPRRGERRLRRRVPRRRRLEPHDQRVGTDRGGAQPFGAATIRSHQQVAGPLLDEIDRERAVGVGLLRVAVGGHDLGADQQEAHAIEHATAAFGARQAGVGVATDDDGAFVAGGRTTGARAPRLAAEAEVAPPGEHAEHEDDAGGDSDRGPAEDGVHNARIIRARTLNVRREAPELRARCADRRARRRRRRGDSPGSPRSHRPPAGRRGSAS